MARSVPLLFTWRRVVVTHPTLTAADRHVALTLALHMDENGGSCFPSINTLAAECARKRHTIIASINTLCEANLLKASKRHRQVTRYQAWVPQETPKARGALSVPSGLSLVPQGTPQVFKTDSDGAALGGAPSEQVAFDAAWVSEQAAGL